MPGQLRRKPPKCHVPLGISSPCRSRTEPRLRATCTQNLVKIVRVVPEISSQTDRQTQRHRQTHTQTHSLQYFATAPASEVIKQQEAQLPQMDCATRNVSKFVLCFTSCWSYKVSNIKVTFKVIQGH